MDYSSGYPPDGKFQHFDEEQQHLAGNGSRAVGWMPISHDKVESMRDQDTVSVSEIQSRSPTDLDQTMKKHVRRLRLVVRMLAFALSCFMLYSQVYMLNKYLSTRGIIRDNRNAWATTTTIWPTIVLLCSSAITVIITAIMLLSYAWGVKKANWAAMRLYMPWVAIEILAHISIWVATVIAYRVGKTGSDLWGWSCSNKAAAIQIHFEEVNFSFACNLQSDAWFVSIAQMIVVLLSGIAWLLAWRRNSHQKKLRYRESLMQNSEYYRHSGIPPPAAY